MSNTFLSNGTVRKFMFSTINLEQFNALSAQGYNLIPLVLETFADLDTPLSLYLKLANQPFSYLLESVQGGERFGRYSIIGLPAKTRIVANGNHVQVLEGNAIIESADNTNPLDFVKNYAHLWDKVLVYDINTL